MRKKVLVVFGTRPEAIKLAPVIKALERSRQLLPVVCLTGQHQEMITPFLKIFEIKPVYDLRVMRPDQNLFRLTGSILARLKNVLEAEKPDCLLIQGDTTSAMAAALAAFYLNIKIGHVEAGLRTTDKYNPFPEEINRRLTSHLADFHFAPTQWAKKNLLAEGISPGSIFVTGNPVVDSLRMILDRTRQVKVMSAAKLAPKSKLIVVTAHRRESFGKGLENICRAIIDIVGQARDVEVIFPVHLNPNVRGVVYRYLKNRERVHLVEPLDYISFVHLMKKAALILTDSGGIQEEAPSLGKPVVVMRETTERPEAIEAGVAKLAGTDPNKITRLALSLLKKTADPDFRQSLKKRNPFGDGKAGIRIVRILQHCL
jgi:UDP-N-acetylglucosamine 2-epimerase (non-hydrolysing)